MENSANVMISDFDQYRSQTFEDPSTQMEVARIICILWHRDKRLVPLPATISTLLCLPSPPGSPSVFIIAFVANVPSMFMHVLELILDCLRADNRSTILDVASETILELCKAAPHHAFNVRAALTERELLPHVSLRLTLDYCQDEMTYLNSTFTGSQRPYMHRKNYLLLPLLARVKQNVFISLSSLQMLSESEICIRLRILCGLTGILGVTYSEEEIQLYLQLFKADCSDRQTQLYLCLLILCGDQCVRRSSAALTETLRQVFNSRHSEVSLMVLVFFHTAQLIEVEKVTRKTLGMPVVVPRESLHHLRTILTQKLFSESELAKRALVLRTSLQSASEFFSISVVYHLLHAEIFDKNHIDVRDWVHHQIQTATLPLHPLLPGILEMYVKSVGKASTTSRISDRDVVSLFRDMSTIAPSHVLAFYYILLYHGMIAEQKVVKASMLPPATTPSSADPNGGAVNGLWPAPSPLNEYGIPALPTKRILLHAETDGDHQSYRLLYPKIAGLVAEQEPQILDIAGLVGQEEEEPLRQMHFQARKLAALRFLELFPDRLQGDEKRAVDVDIATTLTPAMLQPIWDRAAADPVSAVKALKILQTFAPESLAPFLSPTIKTLFPVILSTQQHSTTSEHPLATHFYNTWTKFYTYFPQTTCSETVAAVRRRRQPTRNGNANANKSNLVLAAAESRAHSNGPAAGANNDDDLITDPLLIFHCDTRLWTSDVGVSIALQILTFYMTASRHLFTTAFRTAPKNPPSLLTDAHVDTLLKGQDATIVQMLLETCINSPSDRVRRPVMQFVHQLFIQDATYIRLVHLQTYDERLIPAMVDLLPSMHVCFDYVPELITAPGIDRQVFGLRLMAHLGEKYPIEKSLTLATTIVLPRIEALCMSPIRYARVVRSHIPSASSSPPLDSRKRKDAPTTTTRPHQKKLRDTTHQDPATLQTTTTASPSTAAPPTLPTPSLPPPPLLAPPREPHVLDIIPLLLNLARAFPTLVESVTKVLDDLTLPVPVADLPGAPVPKGTAVYLERLQETVAVTYGKVVDEVVNASPEALDKSIM
ncbi:integrator complex subunit 2-domain-containing protein [Powellomyces hirtus]|nr:integrator complex subunit 2-domain-containing protein [Powellomyces hirtus]